MTKMLLLAVLPLGMLGMLHAPGAAAQVPTQDSVTGSLTEGFGRDMHIWTINASSGPSGESPAGTLELGGLIAPPPPPFPVTALDAVQ